MTTYADAARAVTAPGQRFETGLIDWGGSAVLGFRNAPPTLRHLFDGARAHGDRTMLVHGDERWSFADVLGSADALGHALVHRYGIAPGDRVAIGMRNLPEWIVAFAAITSIGAVSVSLNAWWTSGELDHALRDSGARLLVADEQRLERTAETRAELGIAAIGVRAAGGRDPQDGDRWDDVVVPGRTIPAVDVRPDDDATILYTSGTTGVPKGAVSGHGAITQALFGFGCRTAIDVHRQTAAALPPERRVMLLGVPLFHVTGCVPIMLSTFLLGSRLVLLGRWDAGQAARLVERERVTHLLGVPTQAADLLEIAATSDHDLSSLRTVGGGGAPLAPALLHRIDARFPGAGSTGYGLTETNGHALANTGTDYLTHPTSVGRGTPLLGIAVRDPHGADLPAGEPGEIWLAGPHLFRGYWNRPADTAAVLVGGWFRTGDLGSVDDEGFVHLSGRLTDMVLRGGECVYCAEVENVLHNHPAVREAAVFGLPHERLGEEVAAAVVLRQDAAGDPAGLADFAADLTAYTAARLAAFKVPSRLLVLDRPLPRNAAGKLQKAALLPEFER